MRLVVSVPFLPRLPLVLLAASLAAGVPARAATSARPPGPIRATPTSTPMRFATASRSRSRARFGSAARAGNVPYVPEKVFAGDIGDQSFIATLFVSYYNDCFFYFTVATQRCFDFS